MFFLTRSISDESFIIKQICHLVILSCFNSKDGISQIAIVMGSCTAVSIFSFHNIFISKQNKSSKFRGVPTFQRWQMKV